ncbi:MAG: hypothetical protein JWQ88_1758, partial [Rhodoferax sp.]|nr:hypothetical protein [Rhodoferax sp.]
MSTGERKPASAELASSSPRDLAPCTTRALSAPWSLPRNPERCFWRTLHFAQFRDALAWPSSEVRNAENVYCVRPPRVAGEGRQRSNHGRRKSTSTPGWHRIWPKPRPIPFLSSRCFETTQTAHRSPQDCRVVLPRLRWQQSTQPAPTSEMASSAWRRRLERGRFLTSANNQPVGPPRRKPMTSRISRMNEDMMVHVVDHVMMGSTVCGIQHRACAGDARIEGVADQRVELRLGQRLTSDIPPHPRLRHIKAVSKLGIHLGGGQDSRQFLL